MPKVCKHSIDEQCSTYYPAGTQFRSCLDQHLGLLLYESDYEFLADKYDQTRSGRINYRAFSEGLENGTWEVV